MKKILIIGISLDEQKIIEANKPSQMGPISVETTASFGQPAIFWKTTPPSLLVVHLPQDQKLEAFFYKKIKTDLPPELPILFLTETISTALMQVANMMRKVRIMKTPIEEATLAKYLKELLLDFSSHQAAVRYPTDQPVVIRSVFKGGSLKGVIKNLSKSGAYIETALESVKLDVEDVVVIEVKVDDAKTSEPKIYNFDAKVVWRKSASATSIGYGVTFLDKEDMLSSILKSPAN